MQRSGSSYGCLPSVTQFNIISTKSMTIQGWVMELGVICPYLSNIQRSKRVKNEKLKLLQSIYVNITGKYVLRFGRVFGPKGYGQISWDIMQYPFCIAI